MILELDEGINSMTCGGFISWRVTWLRYVVLKRVLISKRNIVLEGNVFLKCCVEERRTM